MKDGFVRTAYGRLHYLESGRGRPLILLHSNGNSAYQYEELAGHLAAHARVIAWDQPGHGDSEPTGRHFTVEDFSDAVLSFMDALALASASVMGSSIGGAIAADLGARHPGRLDKLIVVEAPVRTPEEWQKGWPSVEKNYAFATQTAEQVAARMRNVTPALLERWNIDRNKAGPWAMLDVMWALREYDVRAAMASITAPTMIIYGEKSPVLAGANAFAAAVTGAKLVLMKDCGHFPMLDDAPGLARTMAEFLAA